MLKPQKLKIFPTTLANGSKLRKLLEKNIKLQVGVERKEVALLLSAGIDSTVVGIAAHKLGHKVHAYTFQLGEEQSFDSKWAENTAKHFGWEWTLIKVPRDLKRLQSDFHKMRTELDCVKKRDYECTWPMMYVYPKIKEVHVLSGLVFDAYFILSRNAILSGDAGPKSTKDRFDAKRESYWRPLIDKGLKSLSKEYNPSCMHQHVLLQRKYGLIDCNPTVKSNVFRFFMQFSWQELNMPRQKHFMAGTYPEELSAVGHRNHVNYQLAANVDHFFEELLGTSLNVERRKRVMDMCRDWENAK